MDYKDDDDRATEESIAYLADNPDIDSPAFALSRLVVNHPENPREALADILARFDHLSFEDMSRLVYIADDMDCLVWVIKHYDDLMRVAADPASLQYTIAIGADARGLYDEALRMADALIEGDAFNPVFWCVLLRAQARLGREEEARATFDSALSLAGDDERAIMRLTDVVYNAAPYLVPEMITALNDLIVRFPYTFAFVDAKCALLSLNDRVQEMVETLHRFLDNNPGHMQALRHILLFNDPMGYEYLKKFHELNSDAEISVEALDEFVNSLSTRGAHRSVDAMMRVMCTEVPVSEACMSSWIEALYVLEKYERIIDVASEYPEAFQEALKHPLRGPATSYAYTMALARLHRLNEAKVFAGESAERYRDIMSQVSMPLRMAIKAYLIFAERLRKMDVDGFLFGDYFEFLDYGKF